MQNWRCIEKKTMMYFSNCGVRHVYWKNFRTVPPNRHLTTPKSIILIERRKLFRSPLLIKKHYLQQRKYSVICRVWKNPERFAKFGPSKNAHLLKRKSSNLMQCKTMVLNLWRTIISVFFCFFLMKVVRTFIKFYAWNENLWKWESERITGRSSLWANHISKGLKTMVLALVGFYSLSVNRHVSHLSLINNNSNQLFSSFDIIIHLK